MKELSKQFFFFALTLLSGNLQLEILSFFCPFAQIVNAFFDQEKHSVKNRCITSTGVF